MATAAVMAGISVASAIAPMIKPMVESVERLFGKGTGATKLDTVVQSITTVAQALGKAGIVSDSPDAARITAQVQAVVDAEKQPGGVLSANPTIAGALAPVAQFFPPGIGSILSGAGQFIAYLEAQQK